MVKNYQSNYNGYDPYCGTSSASGGRSSAVVVYRPSETEPLLRNITEYPRTWSQAVLQGVLALTLVTFVFTVQQTSLHRWFCPPDASTRDAIRLEWEAEKGRHDKMEQDWQGKSDEQAEKERDWEKRERDERSRQEIVRLEWAHETAHHALEVEKREREERSRQETVRLKWANETAHHALEVEKREREERDHQDAVRREWVREAERHAREVEERLAREQEQREQRWARWRQELAERDRLEEEERQKRHMFWANVEVHKCTTYATRAYSARLMNLPLDWKQRLAACQATPLEIHGVLHLPTSCEDKGPGFVLGRWEINEQEPDCTTFWAEYSDKGCTSPGSGKKYITQKLMNLPEGGNWKEFCATTPTSFDHMHFSAAQECFTSVWGVYGQWEIEDSHC